MEPKREKELVFDSVFCDTDLYLNGPMTVIEAKRIGPSLCPHRDKCSQEGFFHPVSGHQCAIIAGLQVARFALKEGHSIGREMTDFRKEKEKMCPRRGWVYSPDRKEFKIIPDGEQILPLVEELAYIACGLEPPKKLTSRVGPDFSDVVVYATTPDGLAIDLSKIQELEGRFGYNAGQGCDVRSSPCSCGAWH